jgi:hypothetical protein
LDRIHAGSKNNIILNEWNNYLFCWEDGQIGEVGIKINMSYNSMKVKITQLGLRINK